MAPLAELASIVALPSAVWSELGARLAASGYDAGYLAASLRVGERLDDAMRAPMRVWRARRRPEPAAAALRLFALGDAVEGARVEALLGGSIVNQLACAGVLVEADGGAWRARVSVDPAFGRYVVSDPLVAGGDAVMGPAATTIHLARAALPATATATTEARVALALDLGCGAGTLAIALAAAAADRVVATDVSPRAVAFARLNARAAGLDAVVDVREGNLFEPVEGERFDLVVAQPPFVARPPGAADAPFLYGGERGDELAVRIVADVAPLLAPGGRAFVLYDATTNAVPVVRGANVLLVQAPAKNLDEHCALLAAAASPALDDRFARAAIAWRDHFEALGVDALKPTIAVVTPSGDGARAGWSAVLATRHFVDAPPTRGAIERALGARDVAFARDQEVLLDATLRLAAGATFEDRALEPRGPPVCVVRPAAEAMAQPFVLDDRAAAVVRAVAAAPRVRDASTSPEDVACVKDALLRGALDVVTVRA